MNKVKALKKDLKGKFSGVLKDAVAQEDSKPSKKVKKLINKSSKKLATAVVKDTKRAQKEAAKLEKKVAKAEKKAAKSNGLKPKKEKQLKSAAVEE